MAVLFTALPPCIPSENNLYSLVEVMEVFPSFAATSFPAGLIGVTNTTDILSGAKTQQQAQIRLKEMSQ